MQKRLLSLLLVLCMVLALVPTLLLPIAAAAADMYSEPYTTTWRENLPTITASEKVGADVHPYAFAYHGGWTVGNKTAVDVFNRFELITNAGYHILTWKKDNQWSTGGVYIDHSGGGASHGRFITPAGYDVAARYTAEYTGTVEIAVNDLFFQTTGIGHLFGVFVNGEMVWPNAEKLDGNYDNYADESKWLLGAAGGVNYGANGTENTGFKTPVTASVKAGDVIEFVNRRGSTATGSYGIYSPEFTVAYTSRTATSVSSSFYRDYNFVHYNTDGVKGIAYPTFPQNWNAETMGELSKETLDAYLQNFAKIGHISMGNGQWAIGAYDIANGTFSPIARRDLYADKWVSWDFDHDGDPSTAGIVSAIDGSKKAVSSWNYSWGITEEAYQTVVDRFIANSGNTSPWGTNFGTLYVDSGRDHLQVSDNSSVYAFAYTATVDGWASFNFEKAAAGAMTRLAIYVNDAKIWPAGDEWYSAFTASADADTTALNEALANVKAYVEAGDVVRFCIKKTSWMSGSGNGVAFRPAVAINASNEDQTAVVCYYDVNGNVLSSTICQVGDAMPAAPDYVTVGYDYTGDGRADAIPATVTDASMELHAVFTWDGTTASRFDQNFPATGEDGLAIFTGGWRIVKGNWNVDYAVDTETTPIWTYSMDMNKYASPAYVGADKGMWDVYGGGCYRNDRKFAVRTTASRVGVGAMYTAPVAGVVDLGYTQLLADREVNKDTGAGVVSEYFAILLNGEVIWPSNGTPWLYTGETEYAVGTNHIEDVLAIAQEYEAFPTDIAVNAGDEIVFVCNQGNTTTWMAYMDGYVTYQNAYALPVQAGVRLGGDFGIDYYLTPHASAKSCGIEYEGEKDEQSGSYATVYDIAAKELGKEITVRPYQVINGNCFYDAPLTLTAAELLYCYVNGEDKATADVAVAMLNYGAAAQTYFNYDVEDLVNAGLTDEQKKVTPAGDYTQAAATPLAGATAKITGISLLLETNVGMKIIVEGDTAYAVQVSSNPEFSSPANLQPTLREDGETYKAIIYTTASSWNKPFYIRVVDELGNVVSRTITYSITAYCQNMAEDGAVAPVTNALLALYDAIEAYQA